MARTVTGLAKGEQVVKRSRFVGHILPVHDRVQAETELERIRRLVPGARHHALAMRLMGPSLLERAGDDGEPSGTAGRPILEVVRRHDLVDVLLVVSRVFGGVLLGAPGLVRAYAGTAALAVEAAALVPLVRVTSLAVELTYPDWARVEPWLRAAALAVEVAFSSRVEVRVQLAADLALPTKQRLVAATSGRVRIGHAPADPSAP